MEPVRIALVGFGWFAEQLVLRVLRALPDIEVVAVVDVDSERRARAAALGLAAVRSVDELPEGCEAVAVLTPHDTHLDVVRASARRGLHVFCEKALAVTSRDAADILRTCAAHEVRLVVGHMQKLFPVYERTIELVRSGAYGRVVAVQVDGLHWCPVFEGWWRTAASCGGLLYWTGIHDLDTMRAIAGAEVSTVYAVAGIDTDDYTEYEDLASLVVTFANGVVGSMQVAEHSPLVTFEESFTTTVVLERGAIAVDPGRGKVAHAGRDGLTRRPVVVESFGSFESGEEAAYRTEFAAFADVVRRSDRPVEESAVDGLRCVELLEAAYRSMRTGAVVHVEHVELERLAVASAAAGGGERRGAAVSGGERR
jgi:predicted dehydrogenase